MNFDFSSEQKMMAEQVGRMLSESDSIKAARQVLEDKGTYDVQLWQKCVEMGLPAITIPQEFNGSGMGYLELCLIAQEVGKNLAPIPFSSTVYLYTEGLLRLGSQAQKKELLGQVATGEILGTLAIAELEMPPTADNLTCHFDGTSLNGTKIVVPDGISANRALVVAKSANGIALVEVDLTHASVQRTREDTLDASKPTAEIRFENTPATPLGDGNCGWDELQNLLDRCAVMFAFEQVGGAESAMRMSQQYSLDRYAFGRQIGSYQAVKHKIADMYIKNELAKSNCYFGAWALENDDVQLPVAAAACRVAATAAFHFASQENIQVHGGVGFTWEYDCHLYYRRNKSLALNLGSEREWKEKLVTALMRSNRPGARV